MDNILDSDCEVLVNTVNCVGVMGKGLALQFKRRYPRYFSWYQFQCHEAMVKLGEVSLYENPDGPDIISFPTKGHWRYPSQLEWIEDGLADLRELLEFPARMSRRLTDITSIAVPPLGCGNGGLGWGEVEPLIHKTLGHLGIRVDIYPPDGSKYQLLPTESGTE